MEAVRLNLLDVEAMEEIREAQEVMNSVGGASVADNILLLRHVFTVGRSIGRVETLPFARVPAVGEFICLPLEEEIWYRVDHVLHTPAHPSHVAEIWATELDDTNARLVE